MANLLEKYFDRFTATELIFLSGGARAVNLRDARRHLDEEIMTKPVGKRTVFTVYVETRDLPEFSKEIVKEKWVGDYDETHLTFWHNSRLYNHLLKKEEERAAARVAPLPVSRLRTDLLVD